MRIGIAFHNSAHGPNMAYPSAIPQLGWVRKFTC